jgi:hypothetical protein
MHERAARALAMSPPGAVVPESRRRLGTTALVILAAAVGALVASIVLGQPIPF